MGTLQPNEKHLKYSRFRGIYRILVNYAKLATLHLIDPLLNPFAPGAGSPPPLLAGRDEIIQAAQIALQRTQAGRFSKSLMLVGLRGVGKTVRLDQIRLFAESNGMQRLRIEAPEDRSLPAILVPELKIALLKISRSQAAKDIAERALRGLAGFVKAFKVNMMTWRPVWTSTPMALV